MNSEQNNYFFVGTKFGDDDYLEYFMKEGKWELGWHNNEENKQYQRMLKLFNKIKPGDVLFAKSTYVKKKNVPFVKKDDLKVSVMKIRGMATVREVLDDGHTIIVDWKKEYIEREWFFFTGQETIWFPSDIKYRTKETNQLIKFAASDEIIIQDYDYFLNHPNWKKYKKLESETMLRNDFLFNYSGILKKSKNLILRGAHGTGKTYLAKEIAKELTDGNEDQIEFVQFHPSYDYTDFVEGLRPILVNDGQINFGLQDGIFKKFCQKARDAKKTGGQDNFVFIIDEINRGEISKIFGELFFSIDPGYRGERGSVSTQYANLHETDDKFYIPENVYIIGTMNDIDRSVDTFDFAMRRRFRFVEVTAESQVAMLDKELDIHAEEAKTRLRNLNAAIENVQELSSHYHIGPSYFLKLKDVDFDYELLWSDYIKPLLEDYLRGSYEESETLATLKKAFELTNNDQTGQQDTGDNDADN
ncbi:AAA family ATPase [Streptococcus oralis subsp. tigurinus]|nr:AAA family ATPase [Streptococcus oralis]MCY7079500.1 AAA family ATPase [Streptococcus oralis]